jgi:histidine triad (HIT) family protein
VKVVFCECHAIPVHRSIVRKRIKIVNCTISQSIDEGNCPNLNCIFCDIVKRAAPSHIIYEDDQFIAILDKYPISIGHTLVLPKKHFSRIGYLSQNEFCAMYARVHQLNELITSRLDASASHISINDGAAANQLIPHVHVHIIPRNENDSAGFASRKLLKTEEMDKIRDKLEVESLPLTL